MANAIVEVADIDCRMRPFDWPFARDAAAEIDAHWVMRLQKTPALFDGRVLLMRDMSLEGSCLRCSAFEVSFRSFLAWRDLGDAGDGVINCFGMSALQASDGAFLLGEMSRSTAGAGRLYFPAGTPDLSDVQADGRVDLEGNVLRELREETGLATSDVSVQPGWVVVFGGPLVACMRRVRSSMSPIALQERLDAFNATQAHPELAGFVSVASRSDFDARRMPPFMLRYLDWALPPDA